MREIKLTQGQVALVDDEDFEALSQYKWCAYKIGNTFYAERKEPLPGGKYKTIRMHQQILNPSEGLEIDHIDHNGLNNQKTNLRIVSRRENGQNLKQLGSSVFPGVCWHTRVKKWMACITINGKQIHLGYFDSQTAAFKAYLDVCIENGFGVLPEVVKLYGEMLEVEGGGN